MTNPQTTILIERLADAPVELVWKALTDIRLLKKWLPVFPDFKPEVGFTTYFTLGPDKDHQYTHICEVVAVSKNRNLSYTWRYKGHPGNSLITYDFANQSGQTKIKLTHTITEPFPADDKNFSEENFKEDWTYIANNLKKFTERYTSS